MSDRLASRQGMKRLLTPLLWLTCLVGCSSGALPNSDCEWSKENAGPLDLSQSMQARHLSGDAERAEDLAIRYADARRGPHSGHFEGSAAYGRTRDQCMASLFQIVGSNHGVTDEQIRWHLAHRRPELDLAVILSFIALYAWAAILIVRRVCRRNADQQETLSWLVMITYTSVIASAVGVLLGEVWSDLMENIRVGNGHLSYRSERIPWSHHRLEIFVGGVFLFWLLAAFHHRGRSPSLGVPWTSSR
jgi:hypothetical protein